MKYLSRKFGEFFEKHGYLYEGYTFWEASKVYLLRMALLIVFVLLILAGLYGAIKLAFWFISLSPAVALTLWGLISVFTLVKLTTFERPRP